MLQRSVSASVAFILLLGEVAHADVFLCASATGHPPPTGPSGELTASAKPTAAQNTAGTRRALAIFAKFKGEALGGSPVPKWARDIFDAERPGSFSHFYDTMSFGALRVRGEVAARRYESAHRAGHYLGPAGEHGRYADFVSEILQNADRDIDFSLFDNDGPDGVPDSGDDDGFVDVVFIILNSVPENFILRGSTGIAHLGLESDFITNDDAYSGTSILISPWQGTIQKGASYTAAIGAMCHEYVGEEPSDPERGWGSRISVDLECADGRWRDAGYPLGVEADPDSGADNLDSWAHDAAYASAHAGNLGDATDVFDGATFREFTTLSNPGSYSEDGRLSVDIRDGSADGRLSFCRGVDGSPHCGNRQPRADGRRR